jgi:poly-gamma-glutamate capsule biosynthesis protein CapA/YwtB (metallophosphatase superfamily)
MKKIFILIGGILLIGFGILLFQKEQSKINSGATDKPLTFSQPQVDETVSVKVEEVEPKSVTFLAGGDISLSRNIAYRIDKANDPLLPFRLLEDVFLSTDFNFANLETPFSRDSDEYVIKDTLVFNAPKRNVEGLQKYNFQIVNLANNHTFDQGYEGLVFTREWLDKNNIKHIGTGTNAEEAYQPEVIEVNGIRIAFFGFSYATLNDGGVARNENVARMEELEKMFPNGFSPWKEKLNADYVVVTMHAGKEYTRTPDELQTSFSRKAIDLGADMIIGAHPHWVQTIEEYKGKYIFYSLGNFIFDQDWSQETGEGLLLKISLEKKDKEDIATLSRLELMPIVITNNSTPRLANEEEKKKILTDISQSEPLLVSKK